MAYLPDVIGDGETPGGLEVAGGFQAGVVGAPLRPSFITLTGAVTCQSTPGNIEDGDEVLLVVQRSTPTETGFGEAAVKISRQGVALPFDYIAPALQVQDISDSEKDVVVINKLGATGNALNVSGPAAFSGVIGEHGKAPAASPTAITGTITAATLAQLTAIVLQLLQALDAKGSITNSAT